MEKMPRKSRPTRERRKYLEDDLRRWVLTHTSYDEPITTERELTVRYQLSRNTVRKVLRQLIDEGVLRSKTGFGIFVIAPEERPACPEKMKRLALCCNKSEDGYRQRLIAGILDYIFTYRSELQIIDYSEMSVPRMIERFHNLKYDAIIYDRPDKKFFSLITDLGVAGIPQVTVNRRVSGIPAVLVDNQNSICNVVDFLRGIGKKKIVFIDIKYDIEAYHLRQNCFLEQIRSADGETPPNCLLAIESAKNPECQIAEFFDRCPDADALFVAKATWPLVQEELKRRNLSYPEKISLVLLDGDDEEDLEQQITIFREPVHQLGYSAAELLCNFKPGERSTNLYRLLPGELVIRKSCRSPF